MADAGPTKTTWFRIFPDGRRAFTVTQGINPVLQDDAAIRGIIEKEAFPRQIFDNAENSHIYYYGAGCIPSQCRRMETLLAGVCRSSHVEVRSDLWGAARALCGHEAGIACILGVALGALAGYFGGTIDDIINFLYSVFAAMPTLLFILSFALLVSKGFLAGDLTGVVNFMRDNLNTDPGMLAVYLAIGLTGWVTLCRVVRAETLKLREAGYIQAAKVAGVPAWKIIVRHIIPNVGHLIIIYFTLRFAYAIMTEVIVSYLGLGVQTAPSWGIMISDGQERLWRGIWWEVGAATIFMFFLVLALHTLGDKLRDIFDPRSERNF